MKSNITDPFRLATIVVVGICPGALQAQNFTTFSEWTLPAAFSEPREFAPAGTNGVYFSEASASKVGFLDINKNVLTEWLLPPFSVPFGMVSQGQKVAFAEAKSNGHVAVLDPNGSSLTEWTIPKILGFAPFPMHVGSQGKSLFFSENSQGMIGMVNTASNEMVLWPMPGAPFRSPNGIAVVGPSSELQVWIGNDDAKITMLNPATNTFRDWAVPALGASLPGTFNVAVAADGSVIFHDFRNSTIGVLNPATNIVRQWRVPTAASAAVEVAVLSPGIVAFTEFSGNKVGTLDLSTPPNQEVAVTPIDTTVTPLVQVVTPNVTALAKTITPVVPTVKGASRTVSGGFVEYPVPTLNSVPAGLMTISNRGILFAEASGNKIGLLQ